MPRRPIQHVIDKEAQRVFDAAIPSQWVVNPFPSDYKKDYNVEIFENEHATGEIFVVQLKGTRNLKARRDGKFVFRLDRDALNYFHERLLLPVFLVVVDTSRKRAYYSFIQEALSWLATLTPAPKSGRLVIDPANDLTDTTRLVESVRAAWKYMRDKFPGSIEAAAEFRRKRLESVDPRFK